MRDMYKRSASKSSLTLGENGDVELDLNDSEYYAKMLTFSII